MRRASPVLLLMCGAVHAQSAGEWRSSEQLWRSTCAYCHDDRIADELRGRQLAPAALTGAVRAGPRAMPAFAPSQISDAELDALADWLARQKRPVAEEKQRGERVPRHGSRDRSR